MRTRPFRPPAGGFAICGMSVNGLIGAHFIPAAHDHGMSEQAAAGLLCLAAALMSVAIRGAGVRPGRREAL